jgi:endonuclease/exonuclease/phosphatase family metal-dependent hydrolase
MDSLSIATFNTHWGVTLAGRPFDVVGASVALEPDVLILQESWRPNGEPGYAATIAAHLGGELHEVPMMSDRNPARPKHLAIPPGPAGDCGLAVISRLPVRARHVFDLGHAPGDAIPRRFGLALTVELPNGRGVTVAGVHASHRLWGSLPQLERLDTALRDLGGPTVIAGDCNMWGPPVAAVLRGRRRAVRGRTWPAPRPHSQIDHIWIDRHLRALDGRVGDDVGSDHRPVRATLAFVDETP